MPCSKLPCAQLRLLLILLTLCLAAVPATAQSGDEVKTHTFRLSGDDEQTDHVPTGVYEVRIVDLVPGVDYLVNLTTVEISTAVPNLPPRQVGSSRGPATDPCTELEGLSKKPPSAETGVPDWLRELRKKKEACVKAQPGNEAWATELVAKTEAKTWRNLNPHRITRTRGIEVTVTRSDRAKSWTFRLLPPSEKRWFTSYGLQAIPDEDEHYFLADADPDADGNAQFQVTEDRNAGEGYDANGLILFTHLWQPEKTWRFGASAGVGFDSNDLEFFVGPSVAIGDFLFVTGGLAFHEQQRLAGSLSPGEILGSSLTDQQLHEETHDFSWFVGVTLGLGSNPFKGKSDDKDPPTDKPEVQDK